MSEVLVDRRGAVALLTLNRPDVLNALSVSMASALTEALEAQARAPEVRVIVITGEGRAFSYDASRMSTDCRDASGEEATYVYDTRTGAEIGVFKEFQTAAPVRSGTITASGNFVFWVSRATGAFAEIKTHVTGPNMSSHSVMSLDERLEILESSALVHDVLHERNIAPR